VQETTAAGGIAGYPWRTAAAGLLIGLLLGLGVPQSDAERERIAPLAARLRERAQAAARRTYNEALTALLHVRF